MNYTVLETAEDLTWAVEVHGLPLTARYAVLYGNEDAPYVIEFWRKRNPHYLDPSEKWCPTARKILS